MSAHAEQTFHQHESLALKERILARKAVSSGPSLSAGTQEPSRFRHIVCTILGTLVLIGGACKRTDSPAAAQFESNGKRAFVSNLADLVIEITGREHQWHVNYPGPDGELGTDDDFRTARDVVVPVGAKTTIRLTSDDFIYTFALPHLGLKEIAVPDLEFSLEFVPDTPGEFQLLGDQMCGYAHADLLGTLVVKSQEDFLAWQARQSVAANSK